VLDYLIRGGAVVDGTGGAPFEGDLGIRGSHIAGVRSARDAAVRADMLAKAERTPFKLLTKFGNYRIGDTHLGGQQAL